jgi:hypothetical protein
MLLDASGYHHDLLPLVERSPAWRQVYQRGDAVLFVRREVPRSPACTHLHQRAAPARECVPHADAAGR